MAPDAAVDESGALVPPLGYAVAQLHGIYILAENADGLIVVDMHAAHERIGYEKLKAAHDGSGLRTQPLLVPTGMAVSEREAEIAEREADTLAHLGFEVQRSGPQSLLLRSVPALLAQGDVEALLRDVLADLREHGSTRRDRLEIGQPIVIDNTHLAPLSFGMAGTIRLPGWLSIRCIPCGPRAPTWYDPDQGHASSTPKNRTANTRS